MSKTSKKSPSYDTGLIQSLENRYGVTKDYIRKSIRGDRQGVIPLRIAEDYKNLSKAKKVAENQALRKLDQ